MAPQIIKRAKGNNVSSARDPAGGVVFATYTSLSTKRSGSSKQRYTDLLNWLKGDPSGEEGVIAFDEIHKAKNLIPPKKEGSGNWESNKASTKVGMAVHSMQLALPSCRILYSSATGMSRPKAIAPFMRLGLWSDVESETR